MDLTRMPASWHDDTRVPTRHDPLVRIWHDVGPHALLPGGSLVALYLWLAAGMPDDGPAGRVPWS